MNEQKKGIDLLRDSTLNKSVGFTREERARLGLQGLLPWSVVGLDLQIKRALINIERKESDIERYLFLSSLMGRNEGLFYRLAIDHIERIMPLIYTPTVGQACLHFSGIFRETKGFYITPEDKGQIRSMLDNWPHPDVRAIVVTDGHRILGLGDLGANGMGIPIGKLSLYTACAGIHPSQCMPVMLDVGTSNKEIREDILYTGYPFERLEGEPYLELVDEFVEAIQDKFPKALIQFEDFLTPNAYQLLNKYRDKILCFNDDIQGTAAVVLAGVYGSTRITNIPYKDLRILFLGAGSAATGIATLMATALEAEGLTREEAYGRCWFVDSKGLVVEGRDSIETHKLPFAHKHRQMDLLEAIDDLRPHVLIGATGRGGTFDQEVIAAMTAINERPVIFALSNPTSKAECTAAEAYTWSQGKAVFASGSPFDPMELDGKFFRPGQGNNAYVFPGIGLGAIAVEARTIPETLFLTAARTLANLLSNEDLEQGALYPRLTQIRRVSLEIAVAVAEKAFELGLNRIARPADLRGYIAGLMYNP
ncbi:MAG: NAD-dependent malic enzyme [Bacteroidia bacterium]|nr:NAD-dependent malic enzyme [Bacteroidia bacterium]